MPTRVRAFARLSFGFLNLSLARERLYGGLGVAVESPSLSVVAEPAAEVRAPEGLSGYARRAVELLDAPGAAVSLDASLPNHVGFGSGTQLALATLAAVADAHGEAPRVRERAPAIGRGGRSGVGVAAFERGGFILDAGHPTERFTTAPPGTGEWSVPPVAARHDLPRDWRFLVVLPDVEPGRSGETEDDSMRAIVERADPAIADRISDVVVRRLLPAVAEGDVATFGAAVAEVDRLNGAWYAEEQGGVYRPPVGSIVDALGRSAAVYGAGQSSWGPVVYGVTDTENAEEARTAGRSALEDAGVDGEVSVVAGRNLGASVEDRD